MQQMARSFGDSGDVQIHASKNIIQFATDRGVFFSRLLEGRFPRWRDSFGFEKGSKVQSVTIPAGVLLGAIRQASVMTAEESRGLDFHFDNSIVGSSLRIYAASANQGESEVEVEINYSGPEMKITLDHRFPTDFLKVLEPENEVTIQFVDSATAVILSQGEAYRTAIMPLGNKE
jgi:DNA polymerase-3 subunit beta